MQHNRTWLTIAQDASCTLLEPGVAGSLAAGAPDWPADADSVAGVLSEVLRIGGIADNLPARHPVTNDRSRPQDGIAWPLLSLGQVAREDGEEVVRRTMLAGKIHRATVTGAELDYEGSVTIDEELLSAADILPGEVVHVWDVTSGSRLTTYALAGPVGSGVVCINGAAAHLVHVGDLVIIASFVSLDDAAARSWQPRVVFVDGANRPLESRPERACS